MVINLSKLYIALILSGLLSCVAAWIIARSYRSRLKQLMLAREIGETAAPVAEAAPDGSLPLPVSLADNQRARTRLLVVLIMLSCLMAITSASIWHALQFPGEPLQPTLIAVLTLLHVWPLIPALALIWRWSRKRLFGMLLLWGIVFIVVALLGPNQATPLLVLGLLAIEYGLALVLMWLVFLGNTTRAIAPWLLMPAAVLIGSVFVGLDTLTYMAEQESPLLKVLIAPLGWLPGKSSVYVVLALFVLLSLIIAWWPMRMFGRVLGRAYSRKWLSDLLVVFTGVWAFALTNRALILSSLVGAKALAIYLPLLWIPAVMFLARRGWSPGRAPTLLVLRVFQRDNEVKFLFDQIIERWRLTGNTVLIAGTDLIDRTLDAADIFEYLDRRLAERFVVGPADVPRRIAAFDVAADIDGRYRINECYCHDTTWQDTLEALMHHSDVVLMDLRGFKAHNLGSRYELSTLARTSHEIRVVALMDSETDLNAVKEAIASGRQDRFTWIDASHFKSGKRREVLACLFA